MKQTNTFAIILALILLLVGGCATVQNPSGTAATTHTLSGTQELVELDTQDLQQIGMTRDLNPQDLEKYGIIENGTNCHREGNYSNLVDSSQGQYSICTYLLPSLNDTPVVIELYAFANLDELNGTYQYSSLHLYSAKGLLSENDYGDQSRFRVSNENDYGGQYNDPNIYTYHLWICKNLYLIHITSSGRSKEAKDHISEIGRLILAKLG